MFILSVLLYVASICRAELFVSIKHTPYGHFHDAEVFFIVRNLGFRSIITHFMGNQRRLELTCNELGLLQVLSCRGH